MWHHYFEHFSGAWAPLPPPSYGPNIYTPIICFPYHGGWVGMLITPPWRKEIASTTPNIYAKLTGKLVDWLKNVALIILFMSITWLWGWKSCQFHVGCTACEGEENKWLVHLALPAKPRGVSWLVDGWGSVSQFAKELPTSNGQNLPKCPFWSRILAEKALPIFKTIFCWFQPNWTSLFKICQKMTLV